MSARLSIYCCLRVSGPSALYGSMMYLQWTVSGFGWLAGVVSSFICRVDVRPGQLFQLLELFVKLPLLELSLCA